MENQEKLNKFLELLRKIKGNELTPYYDYKDYPEKENGITIRFGNEGYGVLHHARIRHYNEKFYLEFGNEGYGKRVYDMENGKVTISFIPEESLVALVEDALKNGKGRLELVTEINDLLGSPGYPDYFAYENNVKAYTGKAIINLEFQGDDMEFSYELPEHNEHKWSGW